MLIRQLLPTIPLFSLILASGPVEASRGLRRLPQRQVATESPRATISRGIRWKVTFAPGTAPSKRLPGRLATVSYDGDGTTIVAVETWIARGGMLGNPNLMARMASLESDLVSPRELSATLGRFHVEESEVHARLSFGEVVIEAIRLQQDDKYDVKVSRRVPPGYAFDAHRGLFLPTFTIANESAP
jgi:hypothetical protein